MASAIVQPSVLAAWHAFSEPLEGRVHHMYLDVKGLVTCGVGNLIDPVIHALRLPWQRPDGSPATRDEILTEWRTLKAQGGVRKDGKPWGLAAKHFKYAGAVTRLRLADSAIDALVATKLESNARELATRYPGFEGFPADAQLAMLSMAWAMGPAFNVKFPLFSVAVRARRWDLAAARGKINATGNPGVVPRNDLNRAHFLAAATRLAAAYPTVLHGPCTLTALKAGWRHTDLVAP